MSGDQNDYILHGQALSFATPQSHFYIETPEDRRGITASTPPASRAARSATTAEARPAQVREQ